MSNPSLRYYACGQTRHDLSQVFKGRAKEVRVFPAGVFLFEHENGERVLFDTGYAPTMEGSGLGGALYRRLLPPEVTPSGTIDRQLARDGISPSSIGRVVLSHLHPDHIGGVRYFPDAQFIMSQGMMTTLAAPKMKEGVIRKLLPEWFIDANKVIIEDQPSTQAYEGMQGYDVFNDGSYVVVDLPGHANGHLGAYVLSRAVLAGDAAWGNDLLGCANDMRALPKAVNHDMSSYQATAQHLESLRDQGVALYFSHDTYDKKDLIG